jgi:hypothetical protein
MDVDSVSICTREELLLDLKNDKLSELVFVGAEFAHVTIEKVKANESKFERVKK